MHDVAGFDVLTLANNHTVDFGRDALLDTVKAVHAAGIQTIGAGATDLQARRPAIVEAGGLRVAFLGYSDVNPYGFNATSTSPGTAKADVDAITADVHAALRRADVAVCFFHWGTELHPEPDSRQQQFAAACLNAGAKVVHRCAPARARRCRDAVAALARRVDARQLRLPVGQRHRAHGDPPRRARRGRRAGLPAGAGQDRRFPAAARPSSAARLTAKPKADTRADNRSMDSGYRRSRPLWLETPVA